MPNRKFPNKRRESEKRNDFSHLDSKSSEELQRELLLAQAELQFAERTKNKDRTVIAERKLDYLMKLLKKK